MPIYHFHVHDGVSLPDEEGQDLPDLAEAKRQAVAYAADLIRELDDKFWLGEEWTMDVTDASGLVLFSLAFVGLQTAGGRGAEPERPLEVN